MSTPEPLAGRPESAIDPAAAETVAADVAADSHPAPAKETDAVVIDAASGAPAAEEPAAEEPGDDAESEEQAAPVEVTVERRVEMTRSVRFGRVLLITAALGAVIVAGIALIMPIDPSADYTRAQAAGLSLLIGAVLGLLLGAIISLLLNLSVRKRVGNAVAIQTDVR